ncbi:PTS system glucose-specific EIIA component [Buchnera aphidicola (Cinara kochiana kochiana)]|uniref:PTS system glucose-specific EIIA component n=1 Tax=Buchnera aphidicola (Cinara kochiana kochiana) TaxID=2518976 RepID=A0A451D538_9GAMM|nr:hypothetical protein [Buchnera aphidicola]VFP80961.1 PTS system glucose-specific EIIA component [Buchnera aphidicola (Cinara kochiana kochiana)]
MKKKIYIVSPTTGTIQNIYETKNFSIYMQKIIINSKKNIIVSPINGTIKNNFLKKINFIIQSNPDICICIKNKIIIQKKIKNNIIPVSTNCRNVCAGEIIFVLSNFNHNNQFNHYQTTIQISCKKKINKIKKSLYRVQAGITILTLI